MSKTATRRKPSARQIAEREEKLEAMHEALVAKTSALVTSEGWMEYLAFAARFRQYSFNNTLLILCQRPDATRVAAYRKWQEFGRQVKKGEKSIGIFAPSTRKVKTEDKVTGEEKERRILLGFRIVSVFDVSQTEGDPLPEDVTRPVLLDGEAPEGLWESLAEIVTDTGYRIERGDCGGANGFTRPDDSLIRVREDVSDAQAVKTLCHEVAHMLLHTEDKTLCADALSHRHVAEVEAESIAHLVAMEHGLATENYTLPYLAGWSDGKTEVIAATADRVLKCSREILARTAPVEPEVVAV
jgi:antirestriction protein ArdC